MEDKFIVKPKGNEKKEDRYLVMTLRIEKDLQKKYSKLATQSGHSRNELMCMALQYALEHLEFIPHSGD